MNSFADFAIKLRALQGEAAKFAVANVEEAAKVVEGNVALASGPYRGHKIVATRSQLIPGGTPRAEVKMTSRKAHLLDHNTRPHRISPRRASALMISQGQFASTVNHPGTTGKRMWERGLDLASLEIHRRVTTGLAGIVGRVFR